MNPFGQIQPPPALRAFSPSNSPGEGLGVLLNIIFQLMIVGGGLYTLFNIVLAGYAFLAAGDDSKKVEGAWARIYQSLIGLAFVAGAFVIAAIFGMIFFGRYNAIINPSIPTVEDITGSQAPVNLPGGGQIP